MKYDKKDIEKLGRVVTTGGPRDIQRRQRLLQQQAERTSTVDSSVINELNNEIKALQKKLIDQPAGKGFTPEQMDEEIGKATIAAVNKTKVEYEEKIKKLEIESLQFKNAKNNAESKIKELTTKLESKSQKQQEELDAELEKVEEKYSALVDKYKNKLETAEDTYRAALSAKDDTIDGLKDRIEDLKNNQPDDNKLTMLLSEATEKIERMAAQIVDGAPIDLDPDRPQMEEVFIDPSSDEELESHISVEDVSLNKKEDMTSKVNKLKGLLGKLPSNGEDG